MSGEILINLFDKSMMTVIFRFILNFPEFQQTEKYMEIILKPTLRMGEKP